MTDMRPPLTRSSSNSVGLAIHRFRERMWQAHDAGTIYVGRKLDSVIAVHRRLPLPRVSLWVGNLLQRGFAWLCLQPKLRALLFAAAVFACLYTPRIVDSPSATAISCFLATIAVLLICCRLIVSAQLDRTQARLQRLSRALLRFHLSHPCHALLADSLLHQIESAIATSERPVWMATNNPLYIIADGLPMSGIADLDAAVGLIGHHSRALMTTLCELKAELHVVLPDARFVGVRAVRHARMSALRASKEFNAAFFDLCHTRLQTLVRDRRARGRQTMVHRVPVYMDLRILVTDTAVFVQDFPASRPGISQPTSIVEKSMFPNAYDMLVESLRMYAAEA